jgi:hypothetical protein
MIKNFIIISSFICAQGALHAALSPSQNIKTKSASVSDCKSIIKELEKKYNIPDNLLYSIAHVESKLHPWAVNAQGKSRFFKSKEQAVHHAQALRQKKVKNIGVGCMQINLSAHGLKFQSLSDAFDPSHNIAYSAKLLKSLHDRFGDWQKAVEFYHTANPHYHVPYRARVYRIWNKVQGLPDFQKTAKNRLKIGSGPGVGIGNRLD